MANRTVAEADQTAQHAHRYSTNYNKCRKILNTLFQTIWPKFCFFMQLFLKIFSGMANSVDPDQTAPSGAV